jgi:hypothetical protein
MEPRSGAQCSFLDAEATLHWWDGGRYAWRRDGSWWSNQWSWLNFYGRPALAVTQQGAFNLKLLVGLAQGAAVSVDPGSIAPGSARSGVHPDSQQTTQSSDDDRCDALMDVSLEVGPGDT